MVSLADAGAIAVFAVLFAVLAFAVNATGRRGARSGRRWHGTRVSYHQADPAAVAAPAAGRMPDAADQLRAVEAASYRPQPLLRFQEGKVFAAAEAAVRESGMPWRVFAQVSLGEVLVCPDREGFNAINAKRVDLLIVDADFAPVAAIEYQGTGHHLGKAAARDAIKKEALRKAGIGYIEVTHEHGPDDVRREIGRLAFARVGAARTGARRAAGG